VAEITKRDVLIEKARRKRVAEEALKKINSIRRELDKRQLAIIDDPAQNKAVLGTRRAGKTETWPRDMVMKALAHPGGIVRIWAASRQRCKELVWDKTIDVCNRHDIKVKTHETNLTITFENRSQIRFVGADKDKEAQKKRGDKTILEIVLESQSFGSFLEQLVEDVIEPSLFDARSTNVDGIGIVVLEGTPGPVCTGYWYYVTGDDGSEKLKRWLSKGRKLKFNGETEEIKGANWTCFRIHVLDNPFLPNAKQELAKTIARKGWTLQHPTYLREWCAIWVTDNDALYFKWIEVRNSYDLGPDFQPWGAGWTHVLGWDIGFNHSMALVVWGWHEHDNVLYEAASWSENHTTAQPVVDKIREFQARFNIVAMVADTGGGGSKAFVEEVQSRHGLIFKPAQKSDKFAHVTLMNDEFISARIKTIKGSELSRDLGGLIKDRDWDPASDKPPDSDPSAHEFSHTTDAGLYAWRYASSFLATKAPDEKPKPGSEAHVAAIEKALEEEMMNEKRKEDWWEPEEGAESDDW
jgi:hypothetical protein